MEETIPDRDSKDDSRITTRGVHGCLREATSFVRYEASHQAMGTIFSIVAYGSNSECLQDSITRSFQEIDRLDNLMSHYKPESEALRNINQEAFRQTVAVTPELFNLLQDSLRFSKETSGAFDITVGPLMKSCWGFFRGWGRQLEQSELDQALKRDRLSAYKAGCRGTHLAVR